MIDSVLMTADTVGGVWSYTLELARALSRHGVTVHIATMGPPPSDAQRAEVARIGSATLHVSHWKLEWMSQPWRDVDCAGRWLLALERLLRPDIIHLNGYVHAAMPWSAPVVIVAHSCVLSWFLAVKGTARQAEHRTYRRRVAAGLRAADVVVAPTRAMLASITRHYGEPERTVVIPNGREAGDYPSGRKQPIVLGVGRVWDEAKNIAQLAAIAPDLPWPTVLIGDSSHPVRCTSTELPQHGGLYCTGRLPQEKVAMWMSRASICALPVRYEPFGLAALEAGLAGCALVLGDIPSQREVWGDAACYVPPSDADALTRAITQLACDPHQFASRAAAVRTRALRYSVERLLQSYLDTYHAVMQRRLQERLACAS